MDMVCNLDSAFAVLDQQILHAMVVSHLISASLLTGMWR